MKNVIVDYKKLTPEILNLLVEKFPDGYGIRDVIKFTDHKGHYIEAVEVSTVDTKYMVKISNELVDSMENHEDDDDFVLDIEVPVIDLDKENLKKNVDDVDDVKEVDNIKYLNDDDK